MRRDLQQIQQNRRASSTHAATPRHAPGVAAAGRSQPARQAASEPRASATSDQARPRQLWRCAWLMAFAWLAVGLLSPQVAEAQDDGWNVRNRGRRHQVVLKRFQKIVEARPERSFAYRRMVKMARRSPGLDKLIAQYRRKVKRSPSKRNYRLIYAHLLNTTRQRDKALKQYLEVVKRSPNYMLGHLYVAAIYKHLQQYQKSLFAYQRALKLAQKKRAKRRCLKAMGTLSLLLKKPQQALKYWRQFLQLSPGNVRAREELALAMARHKLYKEALTQWQVVLRKSRGSARRSRVLRKMGNLYEEWGNWQKAIVLYRKAMGFTQRGHWLRRELNERVLQLHRENGKLAQLATYLKNQKRKGRSELAMLARLLDELGRDKEAAGAYVKALKANPSDGKLRQKYITLLEVLNRVPQAIAQYKILIRKEPSEPRHRLAYAEMLSRVGKRKESMAAMRDLARTFSRNTEILNRLANLYRRRRMTKEALLLYKRLIRVEPQEPSHRRALGQYYYQMGEYKKAEATWMGILRSGITRHIAYSAVGQIFRDHEMLVKARKWFKKAAQAKPKSMGYKTQLGELYQRILDEDGELPAKWLKDAIGIWKEIYKKSKLRTRRKRAMQQLFAFYHAQGTLYRLPPYHRNKLSQNPRDIESLRWLGEYHLWRAKRQGRSSYLSARRHFSKILRYQPKDLDALLTLEQLASRKRQWRRARGLLLRAIVAHPQGRRAYYRRICSYSLKLNAHSDAIKYGRAALALNPEDASAHADLARIYKRAKRPKLAIASYREAIRLRPHSFSYYLALADLMRKNGDADKAADLYLHVVKNAKDGRIVYEAAIRAIDLLHPQNKTKQLESRLLTLADAHPRELAYFRALAELYRRQGRMKEYRVAYLKAAATVDQKSQVYKRLAEVAREQGDLQKAIIYFRKMLEESPNPTPRHQVQLASFYLQVGDNTNARKILLALLSEHPNSLRVLRQVAALFYQYNMVPEAIRAYELFLDQEFDSSQLRLRLAELYQRQQKFEAAAGLLSELVWGESDRPVLKRKKKKKKPGARKKKKKKLPYYLRRRMRYRRYRSRYQRRYKRRRAMGMLINIYERLRMLNQWDQRVLMGLSNKANTDRSTMAGWLVRHYMQRQWLGRLEKILQTMYNRNPRNRTWIRHLAVLYQRQGRYADALGLYTKLERINPRSRRYHYIQKLKLVLGMKDKTRLSFFLQSFLSSHMGMNYYRLLSVLRLLEQHNQYAHMEKMLKWALRNGGSRYRSRYLDKLTQVYLKLGKQKKARIQLWQAWKRKPRINRYTSLRNLLSQRQRLLRQLWPLMTQGQRAHMLRTSEQGLMDLLLDRPKPQVKLALVELYTVIKMGKGDSFAQQYLPALWGMTRPSYYGRRLRKQIMQDLLHQGKYKLAIALIRKGMEGVNGNRAKLYYLRQQLRTISQAGLLPPRIFSRFLERQLRGLRPQANSQVSHDEWADAALQLADRYLVWGNYQRAIWWIGVCSWSGGQRVRDDDRFLLRLARAYQRKGKEKLARRNYARVVDHAWKKFNRHPGNAYERFLLDSFFSAWLKRYRNSPATYQRYKQLYNILKKNPKQGKAQPRRRYTSYRYRYRYMMYRYNYYRRRMNKQYGTPIRKAEAAIKALYQLHAEAEYKPLLFRRLRKAWRRANKPENKLERLYHLVAAYHLDWTKYRTQTSLQSMLSLLRRLLPQHPLPKGKEIHHMLANLEAEVGNYKNAIRLYKRLYKLLPANKPPLRIAMMRRIAQIQGQAGQQKAQWKTHLRLSTDLRDGFADKWLAQYYMEKGRLSEAIRYYRQFQRRGYRTYRTVGSYTSPYSRLSRFRRYRRYRYARATRQASRQHLGVAQFLMGGGHHLRARYFLKRCLDSLRLQNKHNYQYRNTMHRAMLMLLHIGQLRGMVKGWEKQLPQRPKDIHLLSLLYKGNQILERPKKVRSTMRKMLALRPYDKYLLKNLLNAYKDNQSYKEALKFLEENYGKRSPKPDKYYLWRGRFFHLTGQKKQAFAAWKLQFEECQKQTNRYTKFNCRYEVGRAMAEVGGTRQALKLYKKALNEAGYYYYSFNWSVRRAATHLLDKKAYSEAIDLLKTAMSRKRNYQQHLDYNTVLYIGLLVRGYKGLKSPKKRDKLLRQLANDPYRSTNAAKQAARTLENAGWLLAAERCFWRALQRSRYRSYRVSSYRALCSYWQRHGLQRLCDGEELKPSQRLEHRQRKQLAAHLKRAGFPYLALLELRKLRLATPNDEKLWSELFRLSVKVGRLKEAKLWLGKFKREQSSSSLIPAMERRLASAANQPQSAGHNGLYSWAPVEVPGWCQQLKATNGRLQGQKCKKQTTRCPRRLVRHKDLLITNDCHGRIIGLDANKGTVRWVHALPKLTHKTTIVGQGSRRKLKVYIYRFYDLQALAISGDDLIVAANENWLENGRGWGSGMHVKLYLRKLNPKTGQVHWKQSFHGDYVRGNVVVQDGILGVSGRTYRTFDLKTGQPLWQSAKGTRYQAWLFGDKTPYPHIARNDGFVVASADHSVRALSRKGKLRWKRRLPWPVLAMGETATQIFVVTENDKLYALSASDGKIQWKRAMPSGFVRRSHRWLGMFSHEYATHASPIARGDRLMIAGTDGFMRAFSTKDGRPLWSTKLGDHSPYPPQLSSKDQTLVHMGVGGTMSFVNASSGQITWRYQFPLQARVSHYKAYNMTEINTPLLVGTQHIWLGLYNRSGRFSINAIARQPQQLEARTQRMYRLVNTLKKQRKTKMALRALTQYVDKDNLRFRNVFLKLVKQRQLPLERRLQWAHAYLVNSKDLQKAIKELPKTLRRRNYSLSPLTTYSPQGKQRQAALVKLILMMSNESRSHQQLALVGWRRFVRSRYQQWARKLRSPLARRFGALMLKHKQLEPRLLAAISLLLWDDQQGRKPLLRLLVKTQKRAKAHIKRLRLLGAKLLFTWDNRYGWQGSVLPQDAALVRSLMKDNNREIRLRAALFLGQLASHKRIYRKGITKRVKTFLARSTSFPNRKLAVLSAMTLARLGERNGVLHLRRLFNRFPRSKQNAIARMLKSQFDDYWGKHSILANYQGKYQINLSLPSFRIIYANRLYHFQQYNEAILHYQMMSKLPRKRVTPIHLAMAYYGIAQCFYALKRYKLARTKYKQALKADPFFTAAHTALGQVALAQKRYKQALQHLKESQAIHGTTPHIAQQLGIAYLKLGQAQKARQLFQRELRNADRHSTRSLYKQAHAYALYKAGPRSSLTTALKLTNELLKEQPKRPRMLAFKARVLYKLKRTKAARSTLNEAIVQDAPLSPYRAKYIKLYKKWFKRSPKIYQPKIK